MQKVINGFDVAHVNKETGEVLCETQGCTRILDDTKTQKQIEAEKYKETHVENFNADIPFVKLFSHTTHNIAKSLTPTECKLVLGLIYYMEYETCILKNGCGNNSHYMTALEIAQEMNMEYCGVTRAIKDLIAKGIMAQVSVSDQQRRGIRKCYVMNPYICINGRNPCVNTVQAFFGESGWKDE